MTDNPISRIFRPDPKLKLMDQVRQVLRYYHYAYRTERSYCDWILRYIKFHGGNTHPSKIKAAKTGQRCLPSPCKAIFGCISREPGVFTKRISPRGLEKFSYLLLFAENIRGPAGNSAGSMYSRQNA